MDVVRRLCCGLTLCDVEKKKMVIAPLCNIFLLFDFRTFSGVEGVEEEEGVPEPRSLNAPVVDDSRRLSDTVPDRNTLIHAPDLNVPEPCVVEEEEVTSPIPSVEDNVVEDAVTSHPNGDAYTVPDAVADVVTGTQTDADFGVLRLPRSRTKPKWMLSGDYVVG